jgi:hypothetical protein
MTLLCMVCVACMLEYTLGATVFFSAPRQIIHKWSINDSHASMEVSPKATIIFLQIVQNHLNTQNSRLYRMRIELLLLL